MVGDFGWEHEGTKSGVGTVNNTRMIAPQVKIQTKGQNDLSRALK